MTRKCEVFNKKRENIKKAGHQHPLIFIKAPKKYFFCHLQNSIRKDDGRGNILF